MPRGAPQRCAATRRLAASAAGPGARAPERRTLSVSAVYTACQLLHESPTLGLSGYARGRARGAARGAARGRGGVPRVPHGDRPARALQVAARECGLLGSACGRPGGHLTQQAAEVHGRPGARSLPTCRGSSGERATRAAGLSARGPPARQDPARAADRHQEVPRAGAAGGTADRVHQFALGRARGAQAGRDPVPYARPRAGALRARLPVRLRYKVGLTGCTPAHARVPRISRCAALRPLLPHPTRKWPLNCAGGLSGPLHARLRARGLTAVWYCTRSTGVTAREGARSLPRPRPACWRLGPRHT